jgi:hypothetical protein
VYLEVRPLLSAYITRRPALCPVREIMRSVRLMFLTALNLSPSLIPSLLCLASHFPCFGCCVLKLGPVPLPLLRELRAYAWTCPTSLASGATCLSSDLSMYVPGPPADGPSHILYSDLPSCFVSNCTQTYGANESTSLNPRPQ